jgi:hypothetical protein
MSEHENDPAGNTQQFRAYVQRGAAEPAAAKGGSTGLIIGVAAVVVIVAVVAGLVLVAL